jgi:hypothetical protein
MADYGVVVTWGDPKAGREMKSLDLWTEVVTQNDKDVAEGLIDSWDAVVFEPSGTPPAGVMRCYGTREQIDTYVQSETFQTNLIRASLLLHNVGMRRFRTGNALAEEFALFGRVVGEF